MDNYTTSFDKRKEQLTSYHEQMLEILKEYQRTHEKLDPSYKELALLSGTCLRKTQYTIYELIEWGHLAKTAQFRKLKNGTRRQTTNVYELLKSYPQDHAPHTETDHAPQKILSSSSLSAKPLKKEEYKDAHVTFEIYVQGMKETRVSEPIYRSALRKLGNLANYSVPAFQLAMIEVEKHYIWGNVYHFANWFHTVLFNKNEQVKVYNENINFLKRRNLQICAELR